MEVLACFRPGFLKENTMTLLLSEEFTQKKVVTKKKGFIL